MSVWSDDHIHLRGLYKQGLSTLGEEEKSLSEEAIKVRVLELLSHRELKLATPQSFKFRGLIR